jgi:predicted phosphodiesterase
MADSRTNSTVFDAVTNLVSGKQPEFTVIGGDVCVSGAYSAWQSEFFRPNALTLISHVPFFFATGNHEGWATNAMAFTRAPVSASNSQDYFSFDYGDVHILVLDTEVSYAPGSQQYLFAQNDLAASTRTWNIVACHKPAYCSGGHGEDAGMKTMTTNIFEPAGVDLVIAGHSHFYQHNLVHNLHHLVVGTAGAPQYVPTTASYTLRSVQDYNYAIFDVTPSTLSITVYNSSDSVLDTLRFSKPSTDVDEHGEVPTDFRLMQNYPNPFNPSTTIRYGLPHASFVTMTVYNTLSQQEAQLVNEEQQTGYHDVVFHGNGLASGVYFYRMQAGDFVASKKFLLLK